MNDWLGTKRVQVDPEVVGNLTQFLSLPYGDGLTPSGYGMDSTEQHFTGKERDSESGLDYFGATHYGSNMGRFMSPDPSGLYFADPRNPQSLNLYSYALNNPLKNIDPTGLYCYYGDTGGGAQNDADLQDASQFDYHSSQSECETADENGNKGQWINDSETHQTGSGDWVDNDNRPQEYTLGHINPAPPTDGAPIGDPTQVVQNNVNWIIQNPGISTDLLWLLGVVPRGTLNIPGSGYMDYKSFKGGTAKFGNFNYGATCRALEMSLADCQKGAGAAAYIFSKHHGPGSPFGAQKDGQNPAISKGQTKMER